MPGLFASLTWCDDIHVIDSGSEDETVALAEKGGAQVYTHPFTGFGTQRNWALSNCGIKHEWMLFLDADETTPPAFIDAMAEAIRATPPTVAGYYCCWKMIIDEVWLNHADRFPKWQFRLLRKGRARFIDYGHGQKEDAVEGTILYLKEPYEHRPLTKGWAGWLERHDRYATQEARERLEAKLDLKGLFSTEGPRRNRALKTFVSRLPGWPFLRFFADYVLNLGFMEGRTGFIYCQKLAWYESLIQTRIRELKKAKRPGP